MVKASDDNRFIVPTAKAVAQFFGVTPGTITTWKRAGMPWSQSRFDLSEIVQWRVKNVEQKQAEMSADDPLMSGPSSPALEAYREKRTEILSLDLEERLGGLVSVDKARAFLLSVASIIRNLGERYQRAGLEESHQQLQEVIEEMEKNVEDYFASLEK